MGTEHALRCVYRKESIFGRRRDFGRSLNKGCSLEEDPVLFLVKLRSVGTAGRIGAVPMEQSRLRFLRGAPDPAAILHCRNASPDSVSERVPL